MSTASDINLVPAFIVHKAGCICLKVSHNPCLEVFLLASFFLFHQKKCCCGYSLEVSDCAFSEHSNRVYTGEIKKYCQFLLLNKESYTCFTKNSNNKLSYPG